MLTAGDSDVYARAGGRAEKRGYRQRRKQDDSGALTLRKVAQCGHKWIHMTIG